MTLLAVAATVLVVQAVSPLAGGPSPLDVGRSSGALIALVAPGLVGVFLFQLISCRPELRFRMAAAGILCELLLGVLWHDASVWPFFVSRIPGAGLAAGALIVQRLAADNSLIDDLVPFAIPLGGLVLPFFLAQESRYLPLVFDPTICRLDGTLGEPAWLVGSAFARSTILALPCTIAYFCLPTIVLIAAALELRYGSRPRVGLIVKFYIAAIIGYALYWLMPAVGPLPTFPHDFPVSLPDLATIQSGTSHAAATAYRNAMPSLHSTWAILAAMAVAERGTRYRLVIVLAAAAVILATLGLGEHWLMDVLAAGPLMLTVYAISAVELPWAGERAAALVSGALLMNFWAILIRGTFVPSTWFMAATIVVSVVVPLLGVIRLKPRPETRSYAAAPQLIGAAGR